MYSTDVVGGVSYYLRRHEFANSVPDAKSSAGATELSETNRIRDAEKRKETDRRDGTPRTLCNVIFVIFMYADDTHVLICDRRSIDGGAAY